MYEVYEEDYDESEYEYDYDGEDPDEEDDYFAETENGDGNDEGDGEEDDDRPKKEKEKDEEIRIDPYRFLRKACPVEKATIPGCNMNDTMQRHIENYLADDFLFGAYGMALKDCAILQNQKCFHSLLLYI